MVLVFRFIVFFVFYFYYFGPSLIVCLFIFSLILLVFQCGSFTFQASAVMQITFFIYLLRTYLKTKTKKMVWRGMLIQ